MSIFGQIYGKIYGEIFGDVGGGGGGPAPVLEAAATPLVDAMVDLLCEYAKQPKIIDLLRSLVTPAQTLSNTLDDMLAKLSVYTAVGAQLDRIGRIVLQDRAGLDDATYRRYLLARIATHRSRSLFEDLIRITLLVLGADAGASTKVVVQAETIATVVIQLLGLVPGQALANILFAFLNKGRAAGVRLILETLTDTEDNSFTTALATFGGPFTAGAGNIAVSTAGFPSSGTLDVDIGTAVYEQVTYNGVVSNSFLNLSPALAHNHLFNTAVQFANTPGQGFATTAVIASNVTHGDTSIVVDTTAGFAASGTLEVDFEGAMELVPYTSINATHFLGCTIANDHLAGLLIRPHGLPQGGRFVTAQDRTL